MSRLGEPELRLLTYLAPGLPLERVVARFGPFSVQPIVVRRALPRPLEAAIAASLLTLHESAPWAARLARCGVTRLAPISLADDDGERAVLDRCERERRAAV